jgi:ATP-dependent RNA helicase SUPV3L1/SUV3
LNRKIHLHVGPTNSGKTYNALKALEEANNGIYAGPLRLLAHEVYSRLNAKGLPCALVTGEEQRIPTEDDYYTSCTVEMTPLNSLVDVAVIDEIQMIADPHRGWAWTQAFLGVRAKEVHLCGEERAIDLIRALGASMCEEVIVHRYKRLSPLAPMTQSLGNNFRNLQKGDAVVAFSRVGIHALKDGIEKATGRRCAIVYGSLPPETRARQAALFNDPDNDYDFLAASDAIGMGLNLDIKRVVFESTTKHDGSSHRSLTVSELRQIGGRAGRFKTARQAVSSGNSEANNINSNTDRKIGWVTTLEQDDIPSIHKAFAQEPEPLKAAGIVPPSWTLEKFARYFPPNTPLSFILRRLLDACTLSPKYFPCFMDEAFDIADEIQDYPLSIAERIVFLSAPITLRDPGLKTVVNGLARCVANKEGGHILDMPEFELELLDIEARDYDGTMTDYLRQLESLHRAVCLYCWMSYRLPWIFHSQSLAFHIRDLAEEKISKQLSALSFTKEVWDKVREKRRGLAEKASIRQEKLKDNETNEGQAETSGEGPGRWEEPGHEEPMVEDLSEYEAVKTEDTRNILPTNGTNLQGSVP